jgi:hypothetical protein
VGAQDVIGQSGGDHQDEQGQADPEEADRREYLPATEHPPGHLQGVMEHQATCLPS